MVDSSTLLTLSLIVPSPPVSVKCCKISKYNTLKCTLLLISVSYSYRQTSRCLTLHTCSSRHNTYIYQISALNSYPVKVTLILSNSAYYPLPGLKHTSITGALATPCTHPSISVYETPPKLLKIIVTNCGIN